MELSTCTFTKDSVVKNLDFASIPYNNVTEKYNITFEQPLSAGQATLKIYYRGFLRDDMEGFYRSYYKEGSKKVWMASTQFQQSDARRAFPSFDVRQVI